MTFSSQIAFERFKFLLKDVLLLFTIQDSVLFNPLAYPVFSLIQRFSNLFRWRCSNNLEFTVLYFFIEPVSFLALDQKLFIRILKA